MRLRPKQVPVVVDREGDVSHGEVVRTLQRIEREILSSNSKMGLMATAESVQALHRRLDELSEDFVTKIEFNAHKEQSREAHVAINARVDVLSDHNASRQVTWVQVLTLIFLTTGGLAAFINWVVN